MRAYAPRKTHAVEDVRKDLRVRLCGSLPERLGFFRERVHDLAVLLALGDVLVWLADRGHVRRDCLLTSRGAELGSDEPDEEIDQKTLGTLSDERTRGAPSRAGGGESLRSGWP